MEQWNTQPGSAHRDPPCCLVADIVAQEDSNPVPGAALPHPILARSVQNRDGDVTERTWGHPASCLASRCFRLPSLPSAVANIDACALGLACPYALEMQWRCATKRLRLRRRPLASLTRLPYAGSASCRGRTGRTVKSDGDLIGERFLRLIRVWYGYACQLQPPSLIFC